MPSNALFLFVVKKSPVIAFLKKKRNEYESRVSGFGPQDHRDDAAAKIIVIDHVLSGKHVYISPLINEIWKDTYISGGVKMHIANAIDVIGDYIRTNGANVSHVSALGKR